MWSWLAMALADSAVRRVLGEPRRSVSHCGTDKLRGALGTLAHNRRFTVAEVSRYIGCDARKDVAQLHRKGFVERVSPGRYFPTRRGWAWIERST